jgi:hypothetical protein
MSSPQAPRRSPRTSAPCDCSGDASQICGDGDHLNIYIDNSFAAASVTAVEGYTYKGCVKDNIGGQRFLDARQTTAGTMTPAQCAALCGPKYAYFGVEYGAECSCGDAVPGTSDIVSEDQCDMACAGDATALCGASNRLTVYASNSPTTPPVTSDPTPGVGAFAYKFCGSDNPAAAR